MTHQAAQSSAYSAKILHIVPRIAPDIDGVGEYSLRLSKQLRSHHNINTTFLVIRPSEQTPQQLQGFEVRSLRTHTVEAFLDQIPEDVSTVVLQYSNYPYLQGKLDVPIWLAFAMKALQAKGIKTVVMFHELPTLKYGIIRIPNVVQQRLSRDLTKYGDVLITNNGAFRETLSSWTAKPVHLLANFATIDEPSTVPKPLSERDRAIVVFGSSDRRRVYQSNLHILKEICERLNIHTLYDAGREIDWDCDALQPSVKVERTGMLSDADVSALMSRCFAGIFDYHRFPRNLSKSSVFAAYCAYGLLPICNGRQLRAQDGIVPNEHYVDTFTLQETLRESDDDDWLQTIASNALALYEKRSLERGAARYAEMVRTPEPTADGATTALISR